MSGMENGKREQRPKGKKTKRQTPAAQVKPVGGDDQAGREGGREGGKE
jgi:hypothetical protein